MKVGVNMTISSQSISVADLAKQAEALGFESLWLPEHPVIPVHTTSRYGGSADGAIPASMSDMADPFIGLAQAAAVTTTLKLGTGICLVPERNPLMSDREAIQRFEAAGADRVIVRLPSTADESALTELERMAAAVLPAS